MLRSLHTHLLFALVALPLTIACGKKVEDGSSVEGRRDGLDLPAKINLEASATGANSHQDATFRIPRDGDVWLPLTISANAATENHQVRLDVNFFEGEPEFSCYWRGQGTEYSFQHCKDPVGRDLGLTPANLRAFSFPLDQGKELRLRLMAAPLASTVSITAALDLRWK
jgi:hypothetical protein